MSDEQAAAPEQAPGPAIIKKRAVKVWLPGYGVDEDHSGNWVRSINLGDDIQSYALRTVLEATGCRIAWYERESMRLCEEYDRTDRNIMMFTGWYSHRPSWPPDVDSDIVPIFCGYHDSATEASAGGHERLRKLAARSPLPVGCRDSHTVSVCSRAGVERIERSGCVTLAMPGGRTSGSLKLAVDLPGHIASPVFGAASASSWLESLHAGPWEYRSHYLDRTNIVGDHDARMELAGERLAEFAKAQVVVTTRLHAALPCLALGVPVVFLMRAYCVEERLKDYLPLFGLVEPIELMHVPPSLEDVMRRTRHKFGHVEEAKACAVRSFAAVCNWIREQA